MTEFLIYLLSIGEISFFSLFCAVTRFTFEKIILVLMCGIRITVSFILTLRCFILVFEDKSTIQGKKRRIKVVVGLRKWLNFSCRFLRLAFNSSGMYQIWMFKAQCQMRGCKAGACLSGGKERDLLSTPNKQGQAFGGSPLRVRSRPSDTAGSWMRRPVGLNSCHGSRSHFSLLHTYKLFSPLFDSL